MSEELTVSSGASANPSAERQRLQRCEMLLDVSHRLSKCTNLDEIIETMVAVFSSELRCERGSLFLNDPDTSELYSRIRLHGVYREVRILNSLGIAGHVYTEGTPVIIHDAYTDTRFNRSVDEQTGFTTQSVLCLPVRSAGGQIMGVAEALNKMGGQFTEDDQDLLEEIVRQGTMALQGAQLIESMQAKRRQEMQFIDVVSEMTEDIKLGSLLQRVMGEATRLLNAERSTLFLNDEKTGELWSEVGQGLESVQIRLPNNLGIAGAVFTSGKSINIPYAYADLRFNPEFDRKTGFFTRSILCVPIVNKRGLTIGVTQVLNRRGGAFTDEDELRLRAFTAQISIALENAKLFADVQAMKNYNESMLESMSSGVITFDADDRIVTCNAAGLRILRAQAEQILQKPAQDFFGQDNAWFVEKLRMLVDEKSVVALMDAEFRLGDDSVSVNLTLQPLLSVDAKRIGAMALLDNISNEKRLKSTMSRYMDPGIADQMLAQGAEALGGKSVMATVLFSDIRGFTTLTEALGAQETVSLLNEYFSLMVACIKNEDGMLDKFIGDAILSAFGIPVEHNDDPDRAVRAAIQMMQDLAAWNKQRAAGGKMTVDIGIGINTDNVVSGNIGSQKRMDYTIIGDGVNLAARLESACKMYGTHILISEYTYKQLRGTYYCREVDLVIVKGKTQPVAVYEVMDYHTAETYPNLTDALHMYRVALGKYRAARFEAAKVEFQRVLDLNPTDNLAPLYMERCDFFQNNPPGDDWAGVWEMHEK